MNEKLKRITAASLIVILLLAGFVVEYTHRHTRCVTGETAIVAGSDTSTAQPNRQQPPHGCWLCQSSIFTLDVTPGISFFVWSSQPLSANFAEVVILSADNSFSFLRRAPPAILS